MSQIHIQNLFPTPLMRVEKFIDATTIETLVKQIKHSPQLKNAKTDLLTHTEAIHPQSNRHYSTISELTAPHVRDFGFLLFGENLQWTIKEMWMNVLSTGGHQSMHSHANSFISGVIYLTDCHASAKTVFHRSMGGREFVFSNTHADAAVTPYNGDRWAASDVERGDMILFPSSILHAVPENQGNERITIAFNALPERLKSWDYEVRFCT